MAEMTQAFRNKHQKLWDAHQSQLDAIAQEWREAKAPTLAQRKAELDAENARYSEACRAIYRKYDQVVEPISKPFQERMDVAVAERDAAIAELKASCGVD